MLYHGAIYHAIAEGSNQRAECNCAGSIHTTTDIDQNVVMQRLEAERQNGIPAIGADSPGRHAPNAGATHTPNGVSADAD